MYSNHFIEILKNRNPLDVILFEDRKSITAGHLLKSAYSLASALLQQGVKKGDKVILAVKPGIEFLQVIYANMMIGTIVSIIDPEMGRENYRAKLDQFSPDHAFVDSRLVWMNEHPVLKFLVLKINKSIPSFPTINNCKLYTTGSKIPLFQKYKRISTLLKHPDSIPNFETISEEEDFLVTYTSGTLSEPKGVVHNYSSLFQSIKHLAELLQKNQDAIIATHLPHYALLGITAGIKVYLWDNNMPPIQKIQFITQHTITTLFGPPSDFVPLIHYLHQTKGKLPACIKNIYLGSAPIYSSFLSRLIPLSETAKISCLYGMTENLMVSFLDAREKLQAVSDGDMVGYPFPGVDISIAADGEVCILSNQMYSHYWQQEKIQGVHHTGDIGKLDCKGRLILLGRKKDMIIRRNFNIYPGLYEPSIHKIKGIHEAVMLGMYNKPKADEEIILVVDGEAGLKECDIMKQLTSGNYSIDKEALPDKILFMDIPHAGRQHKVDRKLLIEKISQSKK